MLAAVQAPQHYNIATDDEREDEPTGAVQEKQKAFEDAANFYLTEDMYHIIKDRILVLEQQIEETLKALQAEAEAQKRSEKKLVEKMMMACDNGEEAMVIEFDVDDLNAFVAGGAMYTKDKLGPSASKEVNFRKLSKDERANMEEAMAREVSRFLGAKLSVQLASTLTSRP